jgi:hypothetical protein
MIHLFMIVSVFLKKNSFLFLSFFILIFFHLKGVVYYDEGYILNSALRIVNGQVPYRDFDMVYTPISFLTVAAFLKIFGVSVFSGRLAALTISLLSLLALYKLLNIITKNNFFICICLLFFISWGPAHINFPWPVMFSICFSLYTLLFYLYGVMKKKQMYFFLAGILTIIVFLSKQNFGLGLIFATCISFFCFNTKKKRIFICSFVSGIAAACALTAFLLLMSSSFLQFFQNLYVYTFKRILVEKTLDTPFLYTGSFLTRFTKLFYYLLPPLFSLGAFYVSLKYEIKYILIAFFVLTFYLLGIRPTTDYNHFVPLLAVSIIALAIIFQFIRSFVLRNMLYGFIIFMIALGFYRAYSGGYYKWEPPLRDATYYAKDPRLQVFLEKDVATKTTELKYFIDTQTEPDEYIFVNYYAPFVYFVSGRKNISRYDLVDQNALPVSYKKDLLQELQKKKVKLIIMNEMNKNEKSAIVDFIKKNYRFERDINGYIIYKKLL